MVRNELEEANGTPLAQTGKVSSKIDIIAYAAKRQQRSQEKALERLFPFGASFPVNVIQLTPVYRLSDF